MKREAVIGKLRIEPRRRNLEFRVVELNRHTAIQIGGVSRTLGRHREIDDLAARKFFDQFQSVLGKGWWR
ncbi:MAG: hypothetical protein WAS54_07175 [Scrofimicrobium sp.]